MKRVLLVTFAVAALVIGWRLPAVRAIIDGGTLFNRPLEIDALRSIFADTETRSAISGLSKRYSLGAITRLASDPEQTNFAFDFVPSLARSTKRFRIEASARRMGEGHDVSFESIGFLSLPDNPRSAPSLLTRESVDVFEQLLATEEFETMLAGQLSGDTLQKIELREANAEDPETAENLRFYDVFCFFESKPGEPFHIRASYEFETQFVQSMQVVD